MCCLNKTPLQVVLNVLVQVFGWKTDFKAKINARLAVLNFETFWEKSKLYQNEKTRIKSKISRIFQAWTYCSSDSIITVKKPGYKAEMSRPEVRGWKNVCKIYLETECGAQTKMSRTPVRIRPQGCAAGQSSSQTLDLATTTTDNR
jgi:hypothetical protein